MTPTLDQEKPHLTVFGDHEHGAAYEQDGYFFDAQKRFIEGACDEAARAKLADAAKLEGAMLKAREALAAAMPDLSADQVASMVQNAAPANPGAEVVDLKAWGEGRKKYPMDRVTAACREQFGVGPTSRAQVMQLLGQKGIIPPVGGDLTIPD